MAVPQFKISKLLTVSDITTKVMLPAEILVYIPISLTKHFVDLQVVDSTKQAWTLRYYTRPNGNRAIPVFTAGWLQFVRAKGVRVGDKLILSGHQVRDDSNGEVQMVFGIQVTRSSNVTYQGEPVYLDVENFL
ncbi:hypothetical protein Dsin_023841 [Dipteronia sinensis]|uniref:TF-B3 domain-containing protein n=1 Tax=Dipteronia sinensis TaxID=43782 RepID=A0AAE0E1A8_9ROSI|nr:hypothetical protein Dsin_023841 [Dipteronia sinensis]